MKGNTNINTLLVALMGFATVIFLAYTHVIIDGETVSAVAAVLTSTVAIHRKGDNNDG